MTHKCTLGCRLYLVILVPGLTHGTCGQDTDPSLVSWWKMEDPAIPDAMGRNDPFFVEGLTLVPGKIGQGATFKPPDSPLGPGCGAIDIAHSKSLVFQDSEGYLGPFTIEAWAEPLGIHPNSNQDGWGMSLIGKMWDGNCAGPAAVNWTENNEFILIYHGGSYGDHCIRADGCFSGKFYHVMATYDGVSYRLFVDGLCRGSASPPRELVSKIYSDLPWTIGSVYSGWRGGYGFPRSWNGIIDEVRIYDRALDGSFFRRGDSDSGGALNLTDAVVTLSYLFQSRPAPTCLDAADADDNGAIQITDAIFTLNHLFLGGPAPSEPFASCGSDGTPDELGCERFQPCL
jgi:hypothetical protein